MTDRRWLYRRSIIVALLLLFAAPTSLRAAESENYVLDSTSVGSQQQTSDGTGEGNSDQYIQGSSSSDNYTILGGLAYFKAPFAPSNLFASTVAATSITWDFTDNSFDEDGFRLYAGQQIARDALPANVESASEIGLIPNTSYTRSIVAYNTFGESALLSSSTASAITLALVPDRPIIITQYTATSLAHQVTIPENDNPDGTEYLLEVNGLYLGADGVLHQDPIWTTTKTFTEVGLLSNTSYVYKAKARNSAGVETEYSESVEVITPVATVVPECTTSVGCIPTGPYCDANGRIVQLVCVAGRCVAQDQNRACDTTAVVVNTNTNTNTPEFPQSTNANVSTDAVIDIPVVDNVVEWTVDAAKKVNQQYRSAIVNNPDVQRVEQVVVQPASVALAVASAAGVAAAVPNAVGATVTLLRLLFQIITEPIFLLTRRRSSWGIVYNSVNKSPIDLAVVRIFEAQRNKLLETRITDKRGRFQFYSTEGEYYLQVQHKEYAFPSKRILGQRMDAQYDNLYFGEHFRVSKTESSSEVVRYNIPLDPLKSTMSESRVLNKSVISHYLVTRLQQILSIAGAATALVNYFLLPSRTNLILLALHFLLLYIFYRLGKSKRVRPWGITYDALSGSPVSLAIIRLVTADDSQILETRVSDFRGRFGFLADPGRYVIHATKEGYDFPTQLTKPKRILNYVGGEVTVRSADQGLINLNLPMDKKAADSPQKPVASTDGYSSYLTENKQPASVPTAPESSTPSSSPTSSAVPTSTPAADTPPPDEQLPPSSPQSSV